MLNKKRWKHLVAAIMCSALVISTPAAYAAEEQPIVQTEAKEENTQDTGEQKEEVKEETTVDSDAGQQDISSETSDKKDTANTSDLNSTEAYITSARVDYDGTEDIVFNFTNGTGDNELKNITKIGFSIDGTTGEEGDEQFNSTKVDTDFTYDLAKGEIVIKKEFVNQYNLVTLDGYYVAAYGTLEKGTEYMLVYCTVHI